MCSDNTHALLTINSGSSSLKFALFARTLQSLYRGRLTAIGGSGQFQVSDADGNLLQTAIAVEFIGLFPVLA